MLYSNSACNPIIYNISNEQFRDGFRQHFKPCLKALCPGTKCNEEDVSNETRETDYLSLFITTKSRMADMNQNACVHVPIAKNVKSPTAVYGTSETRLKKASASSVV